MKANFKVPSKKALEAQEKLSIGNTTVKEPGKDGKTNIRVEFKCFGKYKILKQLFKTI